MENLNLPHIRIGLDESGHAWVEVEGWNLFDYVEDYLSEQHDLDYLWMKTVEIAGQPIITTMTFAESQIGILRRVLNKLDESEIEKIFNANNLNNSIGAGSDFGNQETGVREKPSGIELFRWIVAGFAGVVGFVVGIFLALTLLPIIEIVYFLGKVESAESIADWHRFIEIWIGPIAAGSAAFCVVLFSAFTYPKKKKKIALVAYLYGALALFGLGIPLALEAEVFAWTEIPAALLMGFLAYKGIAVSADRKGRNGVRGDS